MAGRRHKTLRITVVQDGTLVADRVVLPRAPVTLGTSPGSTFAVPGSALRGSLVVFSPRRGGWRLRFAEAARGRIEGPGGAVDLGALVSLGLVRRRGARCSVAVKEDQRGTLAVGAVTLRWEFVEAPPEPARPPLPAAARGSRLAGVDRLFVALLGASVLVHSGAYLALASADVPTSEITLEEIPDRYARLVVPERRPEAARRRAERSREPAGQKAQRRETAERGRDAEATEQGAARKTARAAAVAKAVQSRGLLKVLGSLGPREGGGAVADVFGPGAGAADVSTALSSAGEVAVASGPAPAAARKGRREAGPATIGALATTGAGKVAAATKAEVRVMGSVAVERAEVDSSDIDQAKLGAFVRARMALIKACYENALKRNPGLRGRIAMRFTILETGGLAEVAAVANTVGSPEVAACIASTMRGWRTPFRPSGPVAVEYPFLFDPVN